MDALEEATISADGTLFAFTTRSQGVPTRCALYKCRIDQLESLHEERPDPRDPINEQNVPDILGQPLIDTVLSQHDYDLHFSAHDMLFLTTRLKKNDACAHSWSKSGADYKEWKPLCEVDDCPAEDTLKCLVVRHKVPLRVAITSSGILICERGNDRASTLRTGLNIEHAFITESDRNVVLLARETHRDRSFLRAWKIKINNIVPGQRLANMGRLDLNDDDTVVDVAFLRGGLLRKKRIRAITKFGRVVESRFV